MSNLTIADVEDAVISVLSADVTLSGYVKQFKPLPSLEEKAILELFKKAPAIGVLSPGGDYRYDLGTAVDEQGRFLILCFNRNLRGYTSAHRGTASEKGVYDMIEDCRKALNYNNTLSGRVIATIPRRRRLLFSGERGTAYALEADITWRHS